VHRFHDSDIDVAVSGVMLVKMTTNIQGSGHDLTVKQSVAATIRLHTPAYRTLMMQAHTLAQADTNAS
jgi:hypothetical protein